MGRPHQWTMEIIEHSYIALRDKIGRPPKITEFMKSCSGAYRALYRQGATYAELASNMEGRMPKKAGAGKSRTIHPRDSASSVKCPKRFVYRFQPDDKVAETEIGLLVYRLSEIVPIEKNGSGKAVHFVGVCEEYRKQGGRIEADVRGIDGLSPEERAFVKKYLDSMNLGGEINFL